jgi:hypothetical protein
MLCNKMSTEEMLSSDDQKKKIETVLLITVKALA